MVVGVADIAALAVRVDAMGAHPMTIPVDREAAALKAILDALLPQLESGLLFYAVWTHRVVSAEGSGPVTITCVPDDKRLPNESKIVLRPGADGGYSTPAPGSEIAVGFLNGDPSRPYVHSLDPTATSDNVWLPVTTKTKIAGGGPADARVGDSVNCGYMVFSASAPLAISNGQYFPGNPAGKAAADALVTSIGGTAFRFDLNIPSTTPITGGVITSGSAKVEVG